MKSCRKFLGLALLLIQLLEFSSAANVACIYTNPALPLGYTCTMRFLAYTRDLDSLNVTGTHLAGKTNDDVNHVLITQSGILYVPSPMFDIFKNIQNVEIDNVGLQFFNENSFKNATKLKVFNSYRNKVQKIGAQGFIAAGKSLEELLLSTNTIEEIDVDAFEGLEVLKKLSILDNAFTSIAPGTFRSLNQLEYLNLGYNQLTELNNQIFFGLYNLKELYLFWNKFTTIEAESFKTLPSLEHLFFHSNPLERIQPNAFLGLEALKELQLNNNALKHLDEGAFWGLDKNLESLQLSTNQLESFDASMWSGLDSLKELQLQLQTIKTVDGQIFMKLKSLEVLTMSSMDIEEIKNGAFDGK
jgi:Leucine-rich repeat (LRR) protein